MFLRAMFHCVRLHSVRFNEHLFRRAFAEEFAEDAVASPVLERVGILFGWFIRHLRVNSD
jgi:hypothetical protein